MKSWMPILSICLLLIGVSAGCGGSGVDCGQGIDRCETAGALQCSAAGTIQTCGADADGCLVWADSQVCTGRTTCQVLGTEVTCGCEHGCAVLGERRCEGTRVQECAADGDSCRFWRNLDDCAPLGLGCVEDGAAASCTADCADPCLVAGETRCRLNRVESCGADGGCQVWLAGEDCAAAGEVCNDAGEEAVCTAECLAPCPAAGDTRCQGVIVQVCSDLGGCLQWVDSVDCAADDEICDEASGTAVCTCQDGCPAAGDGRCAGSVVQTCATGAAGCLEWQDGADCAASGQICQEATGSAGCVCLDRCPTLDETRCAGSVIEICAAGAEGCLEWTLSEDCAASGEVCDDAGGAPACICVDTCPASGDTRCQGARIQTCTAGTEGCLEWQISADCAALGQGCDEATGAAACAPHTSCAGDDLGSELGPLASGDNAAAADDFQGSCTAGTGGRDVCFTWTAPSAGDYRFDSRTSSYDTVVMVYAAGVEIACNDNALGPQAVAEAHLEAGTQVIAVVDGLNAGEVGSYALSIAPFVPEAECGDWIDNDSDGLVDCADPLTCQGSAACQPGAGWVGEVCAAHADCAAANGAPACLGEGWVGGYCSQWCELFGSDCPTGAGCGLVGDQALCLDLCDEATDPCRSGYRCCYSETAGGYACVPAGGSCPTNCGDGSLDGVEQCDGAELGGQSCESLGFAGGDLGCTENCELDFSACTGTQACTALAGLGELAAGSTWLRADNTLASCAPAAGGRDACFSWSAPSAGSFRFSALGSTFRTVLQLLDDAGDELACNADAGLIASGLGAGQSLTVILDGTGGEQVGDYALTISDCVPGAGAQVAEAADAGNDAVHWDWSTFSAGPGTAEATGAILAPGSALTISGQASANGDDGPGNDYLDVDTFAFDAGTATRLTVLLDAGGPGVDLDVILTDTACGYVGGPGLIKSGTGGALDGLLEEEFAVALVPGTTYLVSVGAQFASSGLPVVWQLSLCAE